MPNSFAYFSLLAWPFVTLLLFRALPPGRALIWSLLAGYLLLPPLPASFDFPMLPPLSKLTIPSLAALVAVLVFAGRGRFWPRENWARALVALFLLSPVATALSNPEPLVFVDTLLPGLGWRDALALGGNQFLLLLPFLLARRLLEGAEAQRDLLVALSIGSLAYSLPMLLEIRLSPQLNYWIYGYYQHLFEQSLRGDGYRPLVFLYHGLWAAFFLMTGLVATVALLRVAERPVQARLFLSAAYLGIVLILCKSLGALIYGLALLPPVFLLAPVLQLRLAAFLALLALAYPVLKTLGLIPADTVLALAQAIDPERANSLLFRLDNEALLQARAAEKPLFGWGSWGRNHLHDPVSGVITTVSDGRWIITFGVFGWAGFLAEFGLLASPLLLLVRRARRQAAGAISPLTGALALLLAVNLADLILNATLTPITWMISGALLAQAEAWGRRPRAQPREAAVESAPRSRRTVL